MSEPSKGAGHTIVPAEQGSAERRPSGKEKAWQAKTLRSTLEKSSERQAEFTTISGYPIQRLYTPADLAGWDADRDLGFLGMLVPEEHGLATVLSLQRARQQVACGVRPRQRGQPERRRKAGVRLA